MLSKVVANCALLPVFRGKLVQNHRRNTAGLSPLPTAAGFTRRSAVRKTTSGTQFHRTLYPTLSTLFLHTFSDQTGELYPLSTGPTMSTDKVILHIVERSC